MRISASDFTIRKNRKTDIFNVWFINPYSGAKTAWEGGFANRETALKNVRLAVAEWNQYDSMAKNNNR